MSINELTGVALARNTPGSTTKADSGELPKGNAGADDQASVTSLLIKQVPTGLLAAYTAVIAAMVTLTQPSAQDPAPDQLLIFRWLAFAILVLGAAALTVENYFGKAASGARFPLAEVIGVVVAAAGWGLVVPESPVLELADGPRGVALVLVIGFLSTVVNFVIARRLCLSAT